MAKSRNDILFRFLADTKSLEKGTKRASKGLGTTKKAMGSAKKAAGALGLALGARELGQQFSQAVGAASDYEESVNAVEVATGDAADGIIAMGRDSAEAFGVSKTAVNEAAVAFAAFGDIIDKETGGGSGDAFQGFIQRATDFASVMNIDVQDALAKFQSGLAGESEPLRKFGINISAAAVDSFAWANGIAAVNSKLTDAQKVTARYGLIMEQTNKTAGDFDNTSESLANQQKILAAELENARIELGTKLQPAMLAATQQGLRLVEFLGDGINATAVWSEGLKTFAHELSLGLIDGPTDAEKATAELASTVKFATQLIDDGRKPTQVLAEWMAHMGKNAELTADQIKDMGSALGFTDDEIRESIQLSIRNAEALGLTSDEILIMRQAMANTVPVLSDTDGALWSYQEALGGVSEALHAVNEDHDTFLDWLAETPGAIAATADAQAFRDYADAIKSLYGVPQWVQDNYDDAVRRGRSTSRGSTGGGGTGGEFHTGGVVGGPTGSEQLIVAKGGERVGTRNSQGGGGVTINITAGIGDPVAIAEQVQDLLELYGRTNGTF